MTVGNRLGLHARAAAQLVRLAKTFESSVSLSRLDGPTSADAKSILALLTLAASQGAELKIVVDGLDEAKALDAVKALFDENFGED